MEILFLGWYIIGWVILLILLFITPLICIGVVIKWADLVAWSAPDLPYPHWVRKLLSTRLLLHIAIFVTFLIIILKYADKVDFIAPIAAITGVSISPIWLLICLNGFWLARNFSDASVKTLRLKSIAITIGFVGYLLLYGWFVLFPVTFIHRFATPFFFLSPLNLLLGFTFLRTPVTPPPNGRRPIKWIVRDVLICYAITLAVFAFPPFFTD